MASPFRLARRFALTSGTLLVLAGCGLRLHWYGAGAHLSGEAPMSHDMPSMGAGAGTAALVGSLLLVEGALLTVTGLVVLRPPSRLAARAAATANPDTNAHTNPDKNPTTHERTEELTMATQHDSQAGHDFDVEMAQVVSIGGGLASFAVVDRLRIAGLSTSEVRVVSTTTDPTAHFAEVCRSSGMLPSDRLRSESSARMDNIWGFPGYAATEARRRLSPTPLLRTLLEPVAAEPYTPTLDLLTDGVAREAARIGWRDIVAEGEAYRVTALPGGDYLVLVHREGRRDLAIQTRWVHLALGSTGPLVPGATQAFRDAHGAERVVHAYEPHEEVYQALCRRGGSVLVRGSGMASARVLERLIDDREQTGRDVHIWHLFRTYHAAPSGPRTRRHDAGHGFHYQWYGFPKAAYGGQLREEIRRLDEPERIELAKRLGATSTPYRWDWARQLRRGREQGWYDAVVGQLAEVTPRPAGVTASVQLATQEHLDLEVDYVIDATGLDARAEQHALVRDLVEEGLGELNELGCLRVDDDFVVSRSGDGGIVASGMTAAGAPFAPVDSFLGMHAAAAAIADSLAQAGIGEPLTPWRSLRSWWRWMEGATL